jgi:hypothetical protein
MDLDNNPIPNLYDLDITSSSKLKKMTVDSLLDNTYGNFISNTVDFFFENGEDFIYPIVLFESLLFTKTNTIELSQKIVDSIRKNKAKIVIFYLTEGFYGHWDCEYIWINNLVERYKFEKKHFVVVTSNLLADKKEICKNFTIYPYPFFLNHISFFLKIQKFHPSTADYFNNHSGFLSDNIKKNKEYLFLCFNGIPKLHRLLVLSEFLTKPEYDGKFILTMGRAKEDNQKKFYEIAKNGIQGSSLENKNVILDFLEKYDSRNDRIYDRFNLSENGKSNGGSINVNAHRKCFVNIVTETLWDIDNCVFFSEKTLKPIYTCQPFIIVGNPYTLKKLKDYGFQTFSRWWDESYDEETDESRRIEKIFKVMRNISTWDKDKCKEILLEMNETLKHNFQTLFTTTELKKLYSFLKTHDGSITII